HRRNQNSWPKSESEEPRANDAPPRRACSRRSKASGFGNGPQRARKRNPANPFPVFGAGLGEGPQRARRGRRHVQQTAREGALDCWVPVIATSASDAATFRLARISS